MSKSVPILYREKRFWAYDVPLSVFLKFLIDAADERLAQDYDRWLVETTNQWRVHAVISDLAVTIDDEWSQTQIDTIIELSQTAITAIRLGGDLSAREIESWPILDDERICTRGHDPVPCEPVARLGEVFISFLQNTLPAPPDHHVWFCTLGDYLQTHPWARATTYNPLETDICVYYRELREDEPRGVIQKIVMHMQQNGCEGMEVKLDPYKSRILAIRRKDIPIAEEVVNGNIYDRLDPTILRMLLFPQSKTLMTEPHGVGGTRTCTLLPDTRPIPLGYRYPAGTGICEHFILLLIYSLCSLRVLTYK